MHDASKHTQTQLEHERQKYRKLRDDHNVPDLEARALERLKDIRNAINNALEEYNDQRTSERQENSQPRLSLLGPLSKLEAASRERLNADQLDQPNTVSDENLQDPFTKSDKVRGSSDAAPEQASQPDRSTAVADVKLQGPSNDEVRVSSDAPSGQSERPKFVADVPFQTYSTVLEELRDRTDAARDQVDQSKFVTHVNFQDSLTKRDEVRGSTKAAPDLLDQSNADADVKLQGLPSVEVRDSSEAATDQFDQSKDDAKVNFQDSTCNSEITSPAGLPKSHSDQSHVVTDANSQALFVDSNEVKGSSNTAPNQSNQPTVGAKVSPHGPFTQGDEAREPTDASLPATGQSDDVADGTLQESLNECEQVRGSTDAPPNQSDQPSAIANASFQGPFAENSERVRDSAVGDGSSLFGVCSADQYATSVQTLAAMLQEFDKHRDSFNKEFIQSDDPVKQQVFQVLKGASKQVTTVAKKWMRQAATDPVRYRTESQALQTMRKDLQVLSLQRRASTRLQELRSARNVTGHTSTDQRDDQYDDQNGVRADGATHTHGLEATLDSAGYIERLPKLSESDHLLTKLKHLRSLQTPIEMQSFQQTPAKSISPQPEGFQALPEIANLEGFKTSVNKERMPNSNITRTPVQTSYGSIRPTSATQTSTTIKAGCHPVSHITLGCRGGGFLRHRLQEVSDSRSCTLTSFSKSTVVKRLEDSPPDTEPDEHASQHPDELETTCQDLNEAFPDSEDPEQASDGFDEDLETPYQDLNEPSSDSEDPDQTSDGSEDQDQTGMKDSDQSSDSADQYDKAFSNQGDDADQVQDPLPDHTINEADGPDSDQYEEPTYESDQFEQSVPEMADDDGDAFDEPSSDQDNDQADQFDEPLYDQGEGEPDQFSDDADAFDEPSFDQGNDEPDQFDEPSTDEEASEQADSGADEYDEPSSDEEASEQADYDDDE